MEYVEGMKRPTVEDIQKSFDKIDEMWAKDPSHALTTEKVDEAIRLYRADVKAHIKEIGRDAWIAELQALNATTTADDEDEDEDDEVREQIKEIEEINREIRGSYLKRFGKPLADEEIDRIMAEHREERRKIFENKTLSEAVEILQKELEEAKREFPEDFAGFKSIELDE